MEAVRILLRKLARWVGRQECIRFGLRWRLAQLVCNHQSCRSELFQTEFFGHIYQGNLASYIDWCVYFFGAYSREELRLIQDASEVCGNDAFVDVGANVGHHTLFAAGHFSQVVAFEPIPDLFDRIQEKIRINKLQNISAINAGLGDRDGKLPLAESFSRNLGTGSLIHDSSRPTLTVEVRKGDAALREIARVGMLKIDVESYEWEVLRGMKARLQSDRPFIFVEWSERSIDFAARMKFDEIFPVQYSCFRFVPERKRWLFGRHHGYALVLVHDMQTDGNFVLIPDEHHEVFAKISRRTNNGSAK